MTICINGCEIEITAARMIPVWIEHQGYRIKWHYREKVPTRLTKKITEEPIWHFRGKWADNGRPAYNGRWFALSPAMTADRGIDEIMDVAYRFAPDAKADFEKWAIANGPRASEIFAAVHVKEIA